MFRSIIMVKQNESTKYPAPINSFIFPRLLDYFTLNMESLPPGM